MDIVRPKKLANSISFIAGLIDRQDIIDLKSNFDVITAYAVIEHCRYPSIAVKNLISLCKHGGFIILTTPAVGRFGDKYALGYSPWFIPPEHLNLISPRGIGMMFNHMGAKIIQFGTFELTSGRKMLRQMIGVVEGSIGFFIKKIAPDLWRSYQCRRATNVREIHYFIIKKGILAAELPQGLKTKDRVIPNALSPVRR
jgi:SAM-dependent methyltransferase